MFDLRTSGARSAPGGTRESTWGFHQPPERQAAGLHRPPERQAAVISALMERACENCGTPDDELQAVRRVYMDPDNPGEIAETEEMRELWCISCTTQYPHLVDEG
jgi:hypothetical protein